MDYHCGRGIVCSCVQNGIFSYTLFAIFVSIAGEVIEYLGLLPNTLVESSLRVKSSEFSKQLLILSYHSRL